MKSSLKFLGGISIFLLVVVAILSLAFGGVFINVFTQLQQSEGTSGDSVAGNVAGQVVGGITGTMGLVLGVALIIVGIVFIIFTAVVAVDYSKHAKGNSSVFLDLFILLFSILSIVAGLIIAIVQKEAFYIGLIIMIMAIFTTAFSAIGYADSKKNKASHTDGQEIKSWDDLK